MACPTPLSFKHKSLPALNSDEAERQVVDEFRRIEAVLGNLQGQIDCIEPAGGGILVGQGGFRRETDRPMTVELFDWTILDAVDRDNFDSNFNVTPADDGYIGLDVTPAAFVHAHVYMRILYIDDPGLELEFRLQTDTPTAVGKVLSARSYPGDAALTFSFSHPVTLPLDSERVGLAIRYLPDIGGTSDITIQSYHFWLEYA